jgi:hypothetical protein
MLVTCATYNYCDMLLLLLASHQHSNPDIPIAVHAVGWPDDRLQAARIRFPRAQFHAHPALAADSPSELKGPVPRSAEILKLKVKLLHEAFQASDEPVIWVDADTLLLTSLKPLLQRLSQSVDFAVTYRPRKRPHAKFAVAVLCFCKTVAAEQLLDYYVQKSEHSTGLVKRRDNSGVAWFHDQLALWDAYYHLRGGFFRLPRRYKPQLMPLSQSEHSIDGSADATFISRRDGVMDVSHMQQLLLDRQIDVSPL